MIINTFDIAKELLNEFDPASAEDAIKIENADYPVKVVSSNEDFLKVIDVNGEFVGMLD